MQTFTRQSGGRHTGFTLLELILVMVILCTVLGLAGPSLKGFFAMHQIEDAAARLVALAKYAGDQAVCEGRVYRLNLSPREKTYWLTVQDQGAFREVPTEWGRMFVLPDDVSMELLDFKTDGVMNDYTEFGPTGRTTPGTIRLNGVNKGDRVIIMCRSATEPFRVVDEKEAEYEDKDLR